MHADIRPEVVRRCARRAAAVLALAFTMAASIALGLRHHPQSFGRSIYGDGGRGVHLLMSEPGKPEVMLPVYVIQHVTYRGLFVVERYMLSGEFSIIPPGRPRVMLPAGATMRVNLKYDYVTPEIAGALIDLGRVHLTDRYEPIGRVALRIEILWGLLAVCGLIVMWSFAGLFMAARRLRRIRRGLCARCRYPLPDAPDPRCPECGTLHILLTA